MKNEIEFIISPRFRVTNKNVRFPSRPAFLFLASFPPGNVASIGSFFIKRSGKKKYIQFLIPREGGCSRHQQMFLARRLPFLARHQEFSIPASGKLNFPAGKCKAWRAFILRIEIERYARVLRRAMGCKNGYIYGKIVQCQNA